MSHKNLQELIKNLQEFYKCPSCETNYHFEDIRFLGEIEVYCFVQLTCHECSLPLLATVSVNGKTRRGRRSDLRASEEAKFASRGAISAGEIAEFHRYISRSKGGFSPKNSNKNSKPSK
jgi:hypothetical protein